LLFIFGRHLAQRADITFVKLAFLGDVMLPFTVAFLSIVLLMACRRHGAALPEKERHAASTIRVAIGAGVLQPFTHLPQYGGFSGLFVISADCRLRRRRPTHHQFHRTDRAAHSLAFMGSAASSQAFLRRSYSVR
jgi:hypothetical protein